MREEDMYEVLADLKKPNRLKECVTNTTARESKQYLIEDSTDNPRRASAHQEEIRSNENSVKKKKKINNQ